MKRTPLLVSAVVLLVLVTWFAWAWYRNAHALETAGHALEQGDPLAAVASVDRMTAFPLDGAFGYSERAAELRDLANRLRGMRELATPEFLALELVARVVGDRFPRTLAAVGEEAARRLRRLVPDPLFVNAENVAVLREGHPALRCAVGGRDLPATEENHFDAAGLEDAEAPRVVRLEDPHGFAAETPVRVRVDRAGPVVGTVKAPAEAIAGKGFSVTCEAGEPVVAVVDARAEGGRLVGVDCRETTAAIRITAGHPPGDSGVGLVAWSFRVADAAGNRSAPVMGRTTSVAAERARQIPALGVASRADLLEVEAWARKHWNLLPDTRRRVAAEAERRLRTVLPESVTLDAKRRLRLPDRHPVTGVAVDGRALLRQADGSFHAAGLGDSTLPRRVALTDPHGFTTEGQLLIRVDDVGPTLAPVEAPTECEEDAELTLEYAANEPLGGVAGAVTVTNGRAIAAFVDGPKLTVKLRTARLPPGTENGRIAWSLRVRDRAGNPSAAVEGGCTLLTDYFTNSIGMKMKRIPPGEFVMGSDRGYPDERPPRKVKIERGFYIGVYEVTQAEWEKVMGRNPSRFLGDRRPVESVSWYDARNFAKRLSQIEGVEYRLPTEAEWEYACRAGTESEYYWGEAMDDACTWFWENSGKETHPVGLKAPNAWGLHDMSGNVFEWCGNEEEGDTQVARGGSWRDDAGNCRSARRRPGKITLREPVLGFRIVR